jgi:hypothetical protein
MKNHPFAIGVLAIILISCGNVKEKNERIGNGLLLSKEFKRAKNQDGKLVDFTFKIDSTEKLIIDQTDFYKLNLTAYDSIYIGKKNDTIFSYDQSIPFKDIFIILNDKNNRSLGRLGNDYRVGLKTENDSLFHFTFSRIQNTSEGDHIMTGYEYPQLIISEMKVNHDGIIMDLKVEQSAK